MEHYKFIILIIDSDSDPIYASFREIIRKYMNTYPNDIKTFFIRRSPHIHEPTIQGDTLYTHGAENFIPGIFEKTIRSMDFCLKNYSFDFLIRTNMSSFWNYHLLLEKHTPTPKNNFLHTPFSREKFVCAYAGGIHNGVYFPSGCGYIMSRDVVDLCVKNFELVNCYSHMDDVLMGRLLQLINITCTWGDRYDFTCSTNINTKREEIYLIYPHLHYHYRVKGGATKEGDVNVHQMLYDNIYGSSA
jgi:hypothetical protein